MNYFVLPGLKGRSIKLAQPKEIVDRIISVCSKHYNVKTEHTFSRCRSLNAFNARSISMYLIRKFTALSLKDVGEIFGRDHTTVISAVRRVNNLIETDPVIKRDIENIRYLL